MRREIREMPRKNLHDFFRALNIMKNDRSLRPNKYDALCNFHAILKNIAHEGPGFLGWHRIYLILLENALNQIIPGINIPYWNNTLDNSLFDPTQSSIFSDHFIGNGRGLVTGGPFAGWFTPHGPLHRNIGRVNRLMTTREEENIMLRFYLEDITYPHAPNWTNIEKMHNHVHTWVGGQMGKVESACYDPMFWIHHAYIDCIWEKFRTKQRMHDIDPSSDYPFFSYGKQTHAPNSQIGFGWLLVRHAVHEYFSHNFYQCAPTPSCSRSQPNCGSSYLKCDLTRDICVPLVNLPNL
ncbi:tyrosinase-like protein [Octopus bimaculoides]|uniref:tyrosinase-like protein n=1 Tax=Octopus bimaculoides TaxID=37653 RepID=UPI00071D1F22|nr:tyrosinase-like protein [Octopus bimaculoides]|eukprot:XP_014773512.1 PREDICTED: tyrosinase-like protein [Octopus bimaculoides]